MQNIMAIKETIKQQLEAVYDKYNVYHAEKGMNILIDKSWEAKEAIREIFSKDPRWNDETQTLRIDFDWKREIDEYKIDQFWSDICRRNRDYNGDEECVSKLRYILQKHYKDELGEEKAKELTEAFPDLKPTPRKNMKTSKIVKKILDASNIRDLDSNGKPRWKEYESKFAKYSDSINPKIIKRTIYVSLNIIDYILSSNGNSWSSCHTIDKNDQNGYHGMHCAGTLSYALDPSTFVVYELPTEYNKDKPYLEKKMMRNLFHYENGVLIQGRLYPQCNDGKNGLYVPFRTEIQKLFASCLGVDNRWLKKGGHSECRKFVKEGGGREYHDWEYQDECNVSRIIALIPDGKEDDRKVRIGVPPRCPVCGKEHDGDNRHECEIHQYGAKVICHDCGREIDPESEIITIDGRFYCDECTCQCERCGGGRRSRIRRRFAYTSYSGRTYCTDHGRDMIMFNGELYPRSSLNRCDRCGDYHTGRGDYCESCQREMA